MQTIQLQLAVTLGDDAAKALAELLGPALKQAGVRPANEFEEKMDARQRASLHARLGGQKPPDDFGLLIDTRQAAKLLKVSDRTLWTMHSSGKMPPPIRIGSLVRWSFDTLKKWVDEGCPHSTK